MASSGGQPVALEAKTPVRLLSLDGGGVRGYSELIILDQLMLKIQQKMELDEPPKPCDIFDLICGTSTGGIIALMLGRLKMTVQETMRVYEKVSIEVFGKYKALTSNGKFSAKVLEEVMKATVQEFGRTETGDRAGPEMKLLETQAAADGCKVFVCSKSALAADTIRLFRSYRDHSAGEYLDMTIWQAARATSAAPTFFKSLKIGPQNAQESFVDGGLGSNNPTKMMAEAHKVFDRTRGVACIVSIGTGLKHVASVKDPKLFEKVVPVHVKEAMKLIVTDCEAVESEVSRWYSETPDAYFRFNVEQGLEDIKLEDAKELGNLKTKTIRYLEQEKTAYNIAAVTSILCNPVANAAGSSLRMVLASPLNGRQPNPILENCLTQLAFAEMNHRSNDIDSAVKGTCEWLSQHPRYKEWAIYDRGLLWIKGKPGCGKSTLLRYALDKVKETPTFEETDLVLFFFFHGRGNELQQTPLGLFRSLLYQILDQEPQILDTVPDCVKPFQDWHRCKKESGDYYQWHLPDLRRFFAASLLKVLQGRSVWLFVDALDESGEDNAAEIFSASKSLLQIGAHTGFCFRICFSCRQYPIIDAGWASEIRLDQENQHDIETYVWDRLEVSRRLMSSDIPTLIMNRAKGVFLWVRLVIDRVLALDRKRKGMREIENEIFTVPWELDQLYGDFLRNFEEKRASLKMVQWICFAQRNLTPDELRWAMIVDPTSQQRSLQEYQNGQDAYDSERIEGRVRVLTSGLAEVVKISSQRPTVQFIHQSVRDFFLDKGLLALHESLAMPDANFCEVNILGRAQYQLFKAWALSTQFIRSCSSVKRDNFIAGRAHYKLSRICIRYLAAEKMAHNTGKLAQGAKKGISLFSSQSAFPFFEYALTSWIPHVQQSEALNVSQNDLLEYFAWPSDSLVKFWAEKQQNLVDRLFSPMAVGNLSHIMLQFQLRAPLLRSVHMAAQVGADLNARDSWHRTLLNIAVEQDDEAIVKLLFEQDDVEVDSKDRAGRTPLSYAAEIGSERTAKLLIKHHDVNKNSRCINDWTPLFYAVRYDKEAVVKLLIERDDVDVNSKDSIGRTPLFYAAEATNKKMVQLLIEQDNIDANFEDDFGYTPLTYAAKQGSHAAIKILLSHDDVTTDTKDSRGRTPLWYAVYHGRYARMIQTFRETGNTDPNWNDSDDETSLSSALPHDWQATIDVLKSHGAV